MHEITHETTFRLFNLFAILLHTCGSMLSRSSKNRTKQCIKYSVNQLQYERYLPLADLGVGWAAAAPPPEAGDVNADG